MSLVLNACRNYTLKINIEIYSYNVEQSTFKIPLYFQSDMYVEHLTLYV